LSPKENEFYDGEAILCKNNMYRPEYNQTKLSHAEKCKRADQLGHNSSEPHFKFT